MQLPFPAPNPAPAALRKVLAIDAQYAERAARDLDLPYFPVRGLRELMSRDGGVDVIETLYPVIQRVPEDDSPEAVATAIHQLEQKRFALEMAGARVLVCPAKRSNGSPSGYKQSDDQRLMIATLSTCLRLRPDFLTFVGADGDYAPMLWELREAGVRSEVVAGPESLASDLRRVAYGVIDLEHVLTAIREEDLV